MQGVAVGVRRPVHARRADARRAARAPPVPRGPVPRADRHVLEVPARAGGLLRARGCLVGRPGAGRRSPRAVDGRGDGVDRRRAPSRRRPTWPRSRRRTASSRTTRCSDTASGEESGVRAAAAVRAVLPGRRAHRAAGVHDGVERSRHVRPAHRVRRREPAARGPADGRQPDRLRAARSPSRSRCRPAAATASASATCSWSRSPTGCCGCGRSTPPCRRARTATRRSRSTAS